MAGARGDARRNQRRRVSSLRTHQVQEGRRVIRLVMLVAALTSLLAATNAEAKTHPNLKHRVAVLSAENRSLRAANAKLIQQRTELYGEIGRLQRERDSL